MGRHAVDNGLSVVAIDANTGKICGAAIGLDSQVQWDQTIWESLNVTNDEIEMEKAFPNFGEFDEMFTLLNT